MSEDLFNAAIVVGSAIWGVVLALLLPFNRWFTSEDEEDSNETTDAAGDESSKMQLLRLSSRVPFGILQLGLITTAFVLLLVLPPFAAYLVLRLQLGFPPIDDPLQLRTTVPAVGFLIALKIRTSLGKRRPVQSKTVPETNDPH